jgi:hypothetical protein
MLLDRMHATLRLEHCGYRAGQAYLYSAQRLVGRFWAPPALARFPREVVKKCLSILDSINKI